MAALMVLVVVDDVIMMMMIMMIAMTENWRIKLQMANLTPICSNSFQGFMIEEFPPVNRTSFILVHLFKL